MASGHLTLYCKIWNPCGPTSWTVKGPTDWELTAARDAGGGDLLGAEASDLLKGGGDAKLLGGAGHVDGHIVAHLAPLQLVLQEGVYELHRLIEREPADVHTGFRQAIIRLYSRPSSALTPFNGVQ